MRTVTLDKVAKIDRKAASEEECRLLPYVGLEHIEKDTGQFVLGYAIRPETLLAAKLKFTSRHVLYGKLRPYLNKVALPSFEGVCTTEILPILPLEGVLDRTYLWALLLSSTFVEWASAQVSGANLPRLAPELLSRYSFTLPPLPEQQRIAAILERADRLRRLRRYALQLSEGYLQAVFVEMFGDPVRNPMGWKIAELGDIGEIQGGLQLSSRRDELRRLELRPDDLLLVEGHGNIEEIGRCAMWNGSIPGCVHQNHLIRVRINRSTASSIYASRYLNGSAGRSYFREVSNTTGGLNTISTGIVKRCPILLPPISHQSKFVLVALKQEHLRA